MDAGRPGPGGRRQVLRLLHTHSPSSSPRPLYLAKRSPRRRRARPPPGPQNPRPRDHQRTPTEPSGLPDGLFRAFFHLFLLCHDVLQRPFHTVMEGRRDFGGHRGQFISEFVAVHASAPHSTRSVLPSCFRALLIRVLTVFSGIPRAFAKSCTEYPST